MVILLIVAAWLFTVVLALTLFRSAALADRAAAERDADDARRETAAEQRARAAALVVVVVTAVPLAAAAAPAGTAHGAAAPCAGAEVAPDPAHEREALHATLCMINSARRDRALVPLGLDGRLTTAAQRHSADMVSRGYFSHVSPGGSTLADRVRRADYPGGCAWRAGETLAWGAGTMRTPASRVRAWLDSRRHREVILEAAYRDVGVGIARGLPGRAGDGFTYTLQLGRRWC